MKLLFIHGTKIKEDVNKNYYTGGSYSEEVWNRYLAISNEFTIVARKEAFIYGVKEAKKFNPFNEEKINFIKVPDLNSSIKTFFSTKQRNKRAKTIKNAVLDTDFLIARLPSEEGNLAIKFARKYNKPYLVEVVGCSWDSLWYYSLKGKLLAPFSYFNQKRRIKNAPYTLYVTKEFLQNRYPTKGESVNCSNVSLKSFNPEVLEKRMVKIKSLTAKDNLKIGTIGALDVKYKGQDSVIEAIGHLKKNGINNVEYELVGGGSNDYLRSIAKKYKVNDKVNFLGSIPHEEIFKWLDTIDIYIQPSKTEGLPRSVVEAMSRGLLTIGTDVGGIPELIDNDFIISKKKKNSIELYKIIKKVKSTNLIEQAEVNYARAKEYDKKLIETRRQSFFEKFITDN